MCSSTCLGVPVRGAGGDPRESRVCNLLMRFSSLGSSKMELSETDFFDTLTTQNDQMSYFKHVLAPLYVFFHPILVCVWGGGGGLPRRWATTCVCSFKASAAQEWSSLSPL